MHIHNTHNCLCAEQTQFNNDTSSDKWLRLDDEHFKDGSDNEDNDAHNDDDADDDDHSMSF